MNKKASIAEKIFILLLTFLTYTNAISKERIFILEPISFKENYVPRDEISDAQNYRSIEPNIVLGHGVIASQEIYTGGARGPSSEDSPTKFSSDKSTTDTKEEESTFTTIFNPENKDQSINPNSFVNGIFIKSKGYSRDFEPSFISKEIGIFCLTLLSADGFYSSQITYKNRPLPSRKWILDYDKSKFKNNLISYFEDDELTMSLTKGSCSKFFNINNMVPVYANNDITENKEIVVTGKVPRGYRVAIKIVDGSTSTLDNSSTPCSPVRLVNARTFNYKCKIEVPQSHLNSSTKEISLMMTVRKFTDKEPKTAFIKVNVE